MSAPTIPTLQWTRAGLGGVLTRFVAKINAREKFVISWDADQPEGYQWELRIHRSAPIATSVLLHRHDTLEAAKDAAAIHVGDI